MVIVPISKEHLVAPWLCVGDLQAVSVQWGREAFSYWLVLCFGKRNNF